MFVFSFKLKIRHIVSIILTILIIIGAAYVVKHPAREVFAPSEMVYGVCYGENKT